jgi:penicillin-binding protein 2
MAVTAPPRRLDRPDWGVSDPHLIRRRAWFSIGFLFFIFVGLIGRLWYLQVVEGNEFYALAQQNRVRPVPLAAPRGLVLDAKGRILATSRTEHSVAVVPAALPSRKRDPQGRVRVLQTLGFLINQSLGQIEARIDEALERGAHIYDPIRVLEGADYKVLTLIEENKARLGPAVLVTDDLQRFYPNGSLAAHVLGYTGKVTQEDLEENKEHIAQGTETRELGYDDTLGKGGVERQYDAALSGERGAKQYLVDSRLRPVASLASIPEKPGRTVQLTLDIDLQRAAERALSRARNTGAIAVVDVRDGSVLALASNPTFDPNLFSRRGAAFKKAYQKIALNPKHPLLNRAAASRWAPGSTFKMITAAAGLQQGTINTQSAWHCGGGLRQGKFFGCWSVHGPGVSLNRSLSHSCNVFYYQASLRMGDPESTGPTYLATVARRFGLGQKTGLDLPSDNAGLVPDPAWRREYNRRRPSEQRWYPGNTLNMSIGQGDVLATPLQMALATAAVANGGTWVRPHILKTIRDEHGRALEAPKVEKRSVGIERRHIEAIRQGMRAVVTRGTGKAVALKHVAVAGKTGSAEDANNVLPHAWFVAFAPYDNPRIAMAAIVENAGHGSDNAVPICKEVLEAAFPEPKPVKVPRP